MRNRKPSVASAVWLLVLFALVLVIVLRGWQGGTPEQEDGRSVPDLEPVQSIDATVLPERLPQVRRQDGPVSVPAGGEAEDEEEPLEDVDFWAIGFACSPPSVMGSPLPSSLDAHPLVARLREDRSRFRLSDELIAEAEADNLTLSRLAEDAPIEDVIVAGAIEVLELQQIQMACMMPVLQQQLGGGNTVTVVPDDIQACSEPSRPTALIDVVDAAVGRSEDPELIDAARGLVLAAFEQSQIVDESRLMEVQDRGVEILLSTEDERALAHAFTATPLFGVTEREDWEAVERVVLAHPSLAGAWAGQVLGPLLIAGRTDDAAPWLELTRDCYAERCGPGTNRDSTCDDVASILARFGAPTR